MPQYRLLSCSTSERIAVVLIRNGAAGTTADAPFAVLAAVASRYRLAILPVEASHLSDGEVHLLAILARCQRVTDTSAAQLPRDLRAPTMACARELTARAIRLPYLAIQRQGFVAGAAIAPGASPAPAMMRSLPRPCQAYRAPWLPRG